MELVVHGVVGASTVGVLADLAVSGTSAPPSGEIQTVAHQEVAAVVTATPAGGTLPSRANLLRHTSVLEAVGERTTVVPMRFGVLAPDPQELVRAYLAPEHDHLVATLDRLRDHVELRLRGRYDEPTVIAAVLASDPRAAKLRGRTGFEAKMELGERIVSGIEARRHHDLDRVLAGLRSHVDDVVVTEPSQPLDALVLSVLVHRSDRHDLETAIDDLGRELAPLIALELTGPIPPFSFATGQADAWV